MNYTDEQLNAFLDEELNNFEMSEIRLALQSNQSLAERFENISFVDAVLQTQFSTIDAKPVPQSLINLLSDNSIDYSDNSFIKVNQAVIARHSHYQMFSFAVLAFMVLTFAVFFGFQSYNLDQQNNYQIPLANGLINNGSTLHVALDLTPSARSINLSQTDELLLTPVLTFQNQADHYCREFIIQANDLSSRSLACNVNGKWNILMSTQLNSSNHNNNYATASSRTSKSFDHYVDNMIANDPLSSTEELVKINNGWK